MSEEKVVLDVVAYEVIGSDGSAMILANNVLMDSFAVETLRNHREVNDLIRRSDVAGLVESLEALIVEWESKVRDRDNDYNAGWDHAGQSHAEQVRAALARFQP